MKHTNYIKFKINSLLLFFIGMFAFVKHCAENIGVLSIREAYGTTLLYGDAVKNGVVSEQINIHYGDMIYDDFDQFNSLTWLLGKGSTQKARTSEVVGFDRTVIKTVLATAASFSSASSANDSVTVTLATDAKHNVIERQMIQFNFSPDSGYTNMAYVYAKPADTTTLTLKPADPTLKLGSGSGETVASGTIMNCLGTFFGQGTGSVNPVSAQAYTIRNYTQFMKFPYEVADEAAKQNLYTKGSLRAQLDRDARMNFMKLYEKALIFNGPKWRKQIAASTDTEENSTAEGLIYAIKNGGGPAVKGYDTFSYDNTFSPWAAKLFNSRLACPQGEKKQVLAVCNQRFSQVFWDSKMARPDIDIQDNQTFGILSITTVRTAHGTLKLMEHPVFDEIWPVEDDMPVCLALRTSQLEYFPLTEMYLANGIQLPDATKVKAEYRGSGTILVHNRATGHHGWLFPNERPMVY